MKKITSYVTLANRLCPIGPLSQHPNFIDRSASAYQGAVSGIDMVMVGHKNWAIRRMTAARSKAGGGTPFYWLAAALISPVPCIN